MGEMYFNNREELKDYISDHSIKRLGTGREGICALLDNGSVIKYLYDDYNPDFALQFKDIDVSSFVFAKSGAHVNDYVAGLFMDYAKGKPLSDNKPNNQDLITLSNQLDRLVCDLKNISNLGVLVKDFHCGNIIYDNNQFRVIDTLPYLLLPKGNYEIENLREVMNRMYAFLLEDILKFRIISENYSFYGKLKYLENPSQYIMDLKQYIESICDEEINTLGKASIALSKKIK